MNHLPGRTPAVSMSAGASVFRFNEALCNELLSHLQNHQAPAVSEVQFGCINGRRAAVYVVVHGGNAHTLWLDEDDVRDWFVARYSNDLQQMHEIETEILSAFVEQLTKQRINDSQNYHLHVAQAV